MLTLVAFVVALAVLIAVHEWGHYRVAVACGVRVLRYSLGFGRVLYRWTPRNQKPGQTTEFVVCALPLGGYVKMLDEREGPVAARDRHLAFNTQPLRSRVAIVAAGPVANLVLAVFLYAAVNWMGVPQPRALLASPIPGSAAEQAGLRGGETALRAGFADGEWEPVLSFETLRWILTRGALEGRDVTIEVAASPSGERLRVVRLSLAQFDVKEVDTQLFRRIGLMGPLTMPLIGEVSAGSPAERAGLHPGDRVLKVDATPVVDGLQLRELIRSLVRNQQPVRSTWQVQRQGETLVLDVMPELRQDGAVTVGRIGAYVGAPPEMVTVRHGLLDGLWGAVARTWDMSSLTLRMMGRIVIGEASLKNISGPITIADYAGKSAGLGWVHYLTFLAFVSVSLGVLNLLPLPVLDGGHLMYYLWEAVTGKSVSDAWMERLQRAGMAVLLAMMFIALFNDITRLLG